MRFPLSSCIACVVFLGAVSAQRYSYSPPGAATAPSYGSSSIPFWLSGSTPGSGRYQQLHSDKRGIPLVMKAIELRPAQSATQGARTVDMRVLLAQTDVANASTNFAANYTSTPVAVMQRKKLAWPDLSAKGWTVSVPFDTTYIHLAIDDLLWETQIYGIDNFGSVEKAYPLDARVHYNAGQSVNYGQSCIATGHRLPMVARFSTSSLAHTVSLTYQPIVFRGERNQPGGVAIGVGRTSVVLPGWCESIRTNPLAYFFGRTGATGTLEFPYRSAPYVPAFANFTFHMQGFVADSALGIALTSGVEHTVAPLLSLPDVSMRIYATNITDTVGRTDALGPYGLVVRFVE